MSAQRRTGDRNFMRWESLLPLLVLVCFPAFAQLRIDPVPRGQPQPQQAVKPVSEEYLIAERARRAEQMGDYERALKLWQELLRKAPLNPEAMQAVPRLLISLRQFAEADSLLQAMISRARLREHPALQIHDPTSAFSLLLMRGQVAAARGDLNAAWTIWNGAVAEAGHSPDAVRGLVNVLMQSRLWDESERTIRDFRRDAKQPGFMALELASSLRNQMNFVAAAEELLLFARTSPGSFEVALSYLNQFPDDSSVAEKVLGVLRKGAQRERKDALIWRMLAGYELKAGNPAEYLDAVIRADSLAASGGQWVAQAAQTLLNEHEVELARKGFQRVLSWKPQPDLAARAEIGLAKCLEALGQWAAAKQAYQTFVTAHPTFKEVDEARFRIAEILLNHDHDAEAALAIYRPMWVKSLVVPRAQIGLRIGDCHAWLGQFDEAISAWGEIKKVGGPNQPEDVAQAWLRIARANFWRDSTSKALAALDSIQAGSTMTTAFNDAVLYLALLGEGGVYRAVRAFAEADYASFRDQDSLAAAQYQLAADLIKAGRLAEWARFSQALALRGAGRPQEAIAVLDTFIFNYRESVDLDRAKYTRAVIRMEDLHDSRGALEELQNFLQDHPRSIYLEPARKKARALQARIS